MRGQNKLKVQLKLSISRLRMVQQKDSAKVKQQRRDMAQLIEVRSTTHCSLLYATWARWRKYTETSH